MLHIPLFYPSPGIRVSNTPGAVDEATATTALYLILSTLRHFSKAERSLCAGTWKTPIASGDTHDLSTRTLGILGLGGIGLHLAHLVHPFPMRVVYHNRHRVADAPAWCTYVDGVEALCREADVLSVHVPLKSDTVHLVGEKEIRALKRGSIIVNTARGRVIDEAAMIRALEDGHVCVYFFSCFVLGSRRLMDVDHIFLHCTSIGWVDRGMDGPVVVGICRSGRVS